MGNLLKEALKALCGVNQWCYAVFWKIGLQNPKLLIWEESYTQSSPSNIPRFPENGTSYNISSVASNSQTEDKVHLLVNKMMMDNHINIVGEGLVGRVAFTGEHQWILTENFYRETHPPEVLKELCQQFSAGMQTVVVVPILPHGVVQFGSFTSITEENGFINEVKSMVNQLGNVNGGLLAEHYVPTKASISGKSHLKPISEMKFDTSHLHRSMPSNLETQMNHQIASQHISGTSFTSDVSPGILLPELDRANGPLYRNDEQRFSTKSEPVDDHSYYYHDDAYATPPSGDDLFDILGADFKNKLFGDRNNNAQSSASDSCIYNWDSHQILPCNNNMASSSSNSDSTVFSLSGAEHLLDAMICTVPSTKTNFDGNVSYQGAKVAPSVSLPYELTVQKSTLKAETHSESSSICGSSQLSSWMNSDQKGYYKAKQSSSASTGHSKKSEDSSKTNRKRLKPGENPRPRPKDRQMIQDRVKELREIVPNGAKCSIDALLERTIKHMMFLESVTKHAEKLKQTGESKILSKDGGLLLKGIQGGATWAYEVGSQTTVCPIVVEDLSQPRQMLVEMLCEERGLFLEIADIIRGMGLTILKGVMETRSNKIWARFVVEANRDVTRMEIFVSLVHLLEQSAKTSLAQGNSDHC